MTAFFNYHHTRLRPGVFLVLLFLLGACSHTPQTQQLLNRDKTFEPAAAELDDVPFFPQTKYQCGPAALATVMNYRQVEIEPETLVPQVFIPEKQGSVQIEMVAATRKQGLMPTPIDGTMDNLLTEIAAGNPVLVMQNLGYNWAPVWHYAVAVGYDIEAREVILRSAETRRWKTPFKTFERTWARSDYWGLIITQADHIPATTNRADWLKTAYSMEETGQTQAAEQAYRAGMERWPEQSQMGMALANFYFNQSAYQQASETYRTLIDTAPQQAALWNNFAYVLQARQCSDTALKAAECAYKLAPEDDNINATVDEMRQSPSTNNQCEVPDCPVN